MFKLIKRQIFNLRVWWFRRNYKPIVTLDDRLTALRNTRDFYRDYGSRQQVVLFHTLFSEELHNLVQQRLRRNNAKPSLN